MKAANVSQPSADSVNDYIQSIAHPARRQAAMALLRLMKEATGAEPKMWGTSIVGFGSHHYLYESGREGDTVAVGFAARKQALAVYGLHTADNTSLLEQSGLTNDSKGCVYIKTLDELDLSLIRQIVANAYSQRHS